MAREGSLRRSTSVLTRARRLGRKILRWLEGDSRSQQLRDEVLFWRHWFSTQGSFWPEDYKERLDPNLPIQDHVGRYVDRLTTNPVYILDVGAGPLTKLGKVHASKEIMITATDLLATEYDQVLRDFGSNLLCQQSLVTPKILAPNLAITVSTSCMDRIV